MAEDENNPGGFRQYALVIVFLPLMFSMFFMGAGGGGALPACANANMICDKGFSTITIPTGQQISGGVLVTMHRTFPQPPNVTLTILKDPFTGQSIVSQPVDSIDLCGGNNVAGDCTWTAMPAAVNEIFGTTSNRRIFVDNTAVQLSFSVNVVTAGFDGSAKLRVQISPDQVTWADPCATAGTADVLIINTGILISGSCALGTALGGPTQWVYQRVVGLGGNGIVSPSFGLISISWILAGISSQVTSCFSTAGGGCNPAMPIGVSSFYVQLTATSKVPSNFPNQVFTVQWIAVECANGGDIC